MSLPGSCRTCDAAERTRSHRRARHLGYRNTLDALSAPGKGHTTASLVELRWNEVVLYPKGRVSALSVRPRLRLPRGWSFATALTKTAESNGTIDFAPVSLETLVDSPLIAGAHLATFDLGAQNGAPHTLALVADDAAALAVPAALRSRSCSGLTPNPPPTARSGESRD